MSADIERARDQAWAGRHDQVVGLCNDALATEGLGAKPRMAWLELRSESFIAQGLLDDALADAEAMITLARAHHDAGLHARALNAQAMACIRGGRMQSALAAAEVAVELALGAGDESLTATSLLRLAEGQMRNHEADAGLASAADAAARFETIGDTVGQSRALCLEASAHFSHGRPDEAREAAQLAHSLARCTGDNLCVGNALTILTAINVDLAASIRGYQQAAAAYERGGHAERQAAVQSRMAIALSELGLYRRSLRLHRDLVDTKHRAGSTWIHGLLSIAQSCMQLGDLAGARSAIAQYVEATRSFEDELSGFRLEICEGDLAMAEGDPAAALRHYSAAEQIAVAGTEAGMRIAALDGLAGALLAQDDPVAAMDKSGQATDLHRAHGMGKVDRVSSPRLWWNHSRALAECALLEDAWSALKQAHALLLDGVRDVRDEGLQRSYLNKVPANRAIVRDWLREAATRKLPEAERLSHLRLKSSAGEPFKRMVDTGMRLNELRSAQELHDFLIDEVTELTGAERVLLLLEGDGTPAEPIVAGSLLPHGEDIAPLVETITPWLNDARRLRVVTLRHDPAGANPLEQRSSLVAPLIAGRKVLGFLYADIEGTFGRFSDSDSDLLGILAAQAAVAFSNTRWGEELEANVDARTAELAAARRLVEQRAAELDALNTVSQQVTGNLDTGALIALAGEQVRNVFKADVACVALLDRATQMVNFPYQHGEEIPSRPLGDGLASRVIESGEPLIINSEADRHGGAPGTPASGSRAPSYLGVPIMVDGRCEGAISVQSTRREQGFDVADQRLLSTIAANVGVALRSARLVAEAQDARSVRGL